MKPVLLDTSVIVALLDRSERFHRASLAALEEVEWPLVTCEGVIAESCYLLRDLPGASEAVLENIVRGAFQIPFQISRSAAGVRRIMQKYRDVPMSFADACLVHMAGELKTEEILTLEQDFNIYRWGGSRRFRIRVPLP